VTPRPLPPAPAAVAAYFTRRRGSLTDFTPEDLQHNERIHRALSRRG
jgi:hypothetical protein